jgi:Domain of unknown function (DUF4157)
MQHLATGVRTLEAISHENTSTPKAVPRTRMPIHPLLRLQRSIGNEAVQRLIQAKLMIGQAGDIYEQEAERTAERIVTSSLAPGSERKCACGGIAGPEAECAECRRKRLDLRPRASSQSEALSVPPIVYDVLRSPGYSLDEASRTAMESHFGYDFSKVRVHTDGQASISAREIGARAYTAGQDVVFAAGQYAPASQEGRRLLAHELTHVVQQGASATEIQRGIWDDFKNWFRREPTLADCPDVDDKAATWSYPTAKSYIETHYQKLGMTPHIFSKTTHKLPTKTGMLEMDVNFKVVPTHTQEEVMQDQAAILDELQKAPLQHVKVIVKFERIGDGAYRATGSVIDLLEGHEVSLRSQEALVGLFTDDEGRCSTRFGSIPEPKRETPTRPPEDPRSLPKSRAA